MKLIIATHNPHKVIEIKQLLKDQDRFEVLSLDDIQYEHDVEETARSFEGNAILKAETIMKDVQEWVIADDSGLEIEALNNEPGVYSARYLGENVPFSVKNQHLLDRMNGISHRKARFVSVVTLSRPRMMPVCFRGEIEGEIGYEAKGDQGFGYDPIFYPLGYSQSFSELNLEEKNQISHRAKALSQVLDYLKETL